MKYNVTIGAAVDFAPDSLAAEIIQNVRTILATRPGTVPYDRALGISWDFVDKPLDVARSMARVAIIDALAAYEPRAKVESISFDGDGSDGILTPRVIIAIGEE